jgi:hypothetical protein
MAKATKVGKPRNHSKVQKRGKLRKLWKPRPRRLHITVVDAHHHALKPMWDAMNSGALPSSGVKLLHFDSHPDMAPIGGEYTDQGDKCRNDNRAKKISPKIYANDFDETECLMLSDIATWIPTLVFQGFVDEVIWVCGSWCTQFPEGAVDLVVGRSKKDGMMYIAAADDKVTPAVGYWISNDAFAKLEDLDLQRPWRLHVVRFSADGTLAGHHVKKISSICRGSPWILDIDEDYLSTQNPFTMEFRQLFGDHALETLVKTAFPRKQCPSAEYFDALTKIAGKKVHRNHPLVRKAGSSLQRKNGLSKEKAFSLLSDYQLLCQVVCKTNGMRLTGSALSKPGAEFLIKTLDMVDLPHHITTLPEMLVMLEATVGLLRAIRTLPGVVTVATSRSDEYTPEPQSYAIHDMVISALEKLWGSKRPGVQVHSLDLTTGLSINDRDCEANIRLFLEKSRQQSATSSGNSTRQKSGRRAARLLM